MEFEDEFLDSAVRHQLLTNQQASEIVSELAPDSNSKELAIKKGFIDSRKLDILAALENPKSVVPGYELISVLGVGGFGVVYKATQLNMDRTVALKTIPISKLQDSGAQQRFEREAKIVGNMRHPNIIAAFDFGLADERLFLSMEFIEGRDADVAASRIGPFGEFATWQIIRQVALALSYAAEFDIIHRDIKPGNLILTTPPVGYELPNGVPMVKVADFGLAACYENQQRNDRITMANSMVGTPFYVSPEQLSSDDLDERADIYSLGVTAWHLLEGRPPSHDSSPMDIIMQKLKGEQVWLAHPPASWSAESRKLVLEMCAHDRKDRAKNHIELISRIDEVLAKIELPESPDGRSTVSQEFSLVGDPGPDSKTRVSPTGFLDPEMATSDIAQKPIQPTGLHKTDAVQHSTIDLQREPNSSTTSGEGGTTQDHVRPNDLAGERSTISGTPEVSKLPLRKSRQLSPTIIGAGIALTAALGYFLLFSFGWLGGPSQQTLSEVTGPPVFLFNGMDLDYRNQTGNWEITQDAELGTVLTGNGSKTFNCESAVGEPLKFFRFEIGFDHLDSELLEFAVKFDDSKEVGKVSVAKDAAQLFGNNNEQLSPVKINMFSEDNFGYHQLRIERHVNYWTAFLDGESLGKISNQDNSGAKIEVMVEGGNANFEQVRVFEFSDPESATVSQ
ncbi:MAG: serine/threonine protein kinase [Mariniblastus sp.]